MAKKRVVKKEKQANSKKKQVEATTATVNSSRGFTPISSRNAFLSSVNKQSTYTHSEETRSYIESYELNVACLHSCQDSIQKMFSLGKEVEDKRFPKEYKQHFLNKALTVALPIVLTVCAAVLSVKAGGFSQILNSATWSSFGTALGIGGLIGGLAGGADYAANRIINTEKKINKTVNKRLAKRSKKDMKKFRLVTPLEYMHQKVNKRKATVSKQRSLIGENLSSIMAGDLSCFLDKKGKLKKDFKVLPLFDRIGLKRVLKEITDTNAELDKLQKIIPTQIENDKKAVDAKYANFANTKEKQFSQDIKMPLPKNSNYNKNTISRKR